jgi:hypothetical protein
VLPPKLPVSVFDQDATEPTGKSGWLTQLGQVQVSLEERLLGRILGQDGIAQHSILDRIRYVLEAHRDAAERLLISTLCRDDQRS